MQGIIDAAVEETIRPLLEEHGSWDAIARFAKPLPLRVILAVLGLPSSDAPDMQRWADDVEEWFGGRGDAVGRFDRCQVGRPRPVSPISVCFEYTCIIKTGANDGLGSISQKQRASKGF
jgi:hypothetical protein